MHDRADELVLDQLAPFPLRQVGAPGDILVGELIERGNGAALPGDSWL